MAAATTTDGGTTKRCAGCLHRKRQPECQPQVFSAVLLTPDDFVSQSNGVCTEPGKRKGRIGLAGGRASRSAHPAVPTLFVCSYVLCWGLLCGKRLADALVVMLQHSRRSGRRS